MQSEESRTDLGSVRIHKNVVASIASIAALDVEGVKKIGGKFSCRILERLGIKQNCAILVEFNKQGEVKIEIPLVIKYDFNVPEVADKVQENVRAGLERMTSLSLKDININVQGIER